MHIIIKIFLFILSSLCLFFLVFFTFITQSYDNSLDNNYDYYLTGTYEVIGDFPNYQTNKTDTVSGINTLKFYNFGIGNNIYYNQGSIEKKGTNQLHLGFGIYYIDINSLDFYPEIYIDGAKIRPNGPGGFIINTTHKVQRSIFSLSSKIEVELTYSSGEKNSGTYLDLYPNMYIMYNPILNKQVINADLGRIQNVQYLNMINSPLYTTDIENGDNYILHEDIQKYVFYKEEVVYPFIKNILSYKKFQLINFRKSFNKISQNNFYNFPGEKYIIEYYSYFLNDEKRKAYYKNAILKEIISSLNTKNNNIDYDNIISTLNKLKSIDLKEYNGMYAILYHYYENILYTQHASHEAIVNFSTLISKIEKKDFTYKYTSLITLRNIYEKYHYDNLLNFHKNLNIFITQHEKEMQMSIYNENHRIHNYFLFFLKNILIADFSKVKEHDDIIILFKKYLDIKTIFLEKGDDTTKKTALFDNAQLLKVFVQITKINFFQDSRDNKGLLTLLKTPTLSNKDFIILNENLNKLLDFYNTYQYFIENSNNRKDFILSLSYKKYTKELNEYFEALTDYNKYQLNYDKIVDPIFVKEPKNQLNKKTIIEYLSSFTGVSSYDTDIKILNYAHCTQPENKSLEEIEDDIGYCYKIENLNIEGFTFAFLITPSNKNTITYLSYTNHNGEVNTPGINYILDTIEKDLEEKHDTAPKKDQDKYDFTRFFLNKFIYIDDQPEIDLSGETEIDKFLPPKNQDDSIAIRKLKLALLNNNSPLVQVRDIISITYNYIIVQRVSDIYDISIFPADFTLTIANNASQNVFTGKFSGKYHYKSTHSFSEVSLLINNSKNKSLSRFLLDETPIQLDGNFSISETKDILSKALFNFDKVDNIYQQINNKLEDSKVSIIYNIENDVLNISGGTYKVELFNGGNIKFYNKNKLVNQGRFSQIGNFLNILQ